MGTALVAASWLNVVTPTVGWIGFGIAGIGTLLSLGAQRRPRPEALKPLVKSPGDRPNEA